METLLTISGIFCPGDGQDFVRLIRQSGELNCRYLKVVALACRVFRQIRFSIRQRLILLKMARIYFKTYAIFYMNFSIKNVINNGMPVKVTQKR